MKKLMIILMCALMLVPCFAQAADGGFAGLCNVLLGEDAKAGNDILTSEAANNITHKLLGDTPFAEGKTLNCDLAAYLASGLQPNTQVRLKYNDMGLIPVNYRSAYTTLETFGKLHSVDGYLLPQNPLTYDFLIESMSYFKSDIITHNGLLMYEGTVTDVYLEDGYTNINLSTSSKAEILRTKDISAVTVFKNGKYAPYSRNVLRGDKVRIYTKADKEPIYVEEIVSKVEEPANINSKYTMYKADIYYLEDNMLITKNAQVYKNGVYTPLNVRYTEFNINDYTYIKENFQNVTKTHINRRLLDKNAYIICDANNNALYINVCK